MLFSNKFAVKSIRSNVAHAASQVRKTPIGGLRGDVAQLLRTKVDSLIMRWYNSIILNSEARKRVQDANWKGT